MSHSIHQHGRRASCDPSRFKDSNGCLWNSENVRRRDLGICSDFTRNRRNTRSRKLRLASLLRAVPRPPITDGAGRWKFDIYVIPRAVEPTDTFTAPPSPSALLGSPSLPPTSSSPVNPPMPPAPITTALYDGKSNL
ncbi:hypothetical protein BDN71DRAFT_664787 [Pleurotus eryngii]|uniref:Uncharacterized protein n=1 Tax=Pleurotus eryngii TaxID=5323 RepID=A0A9P5ZGZ7_PLEER|nr:hypothetical protein BDN71DRAFT_664787 [Pleurotus eryngii]